MSECKHTYYNLMLAGIKVTCLQRSLTRSGLQLLNIISRYEVHICIRQVWFFWYTLSTNGWTLCISTYYIVWDGVDVILFSTVTIAGICTTWWVILFTKWPTAQFKTWSQRDIIQWSGVCIAVRCVNGICQILFIWLYSVALLTTSNVRDEVQRWSVVVWVADGATTHCDCFACQCSLLTGSRSTRLSYEGVVMLTLNGGSLSQDFLISHTWGVGRGCEVTYQWAWQKATDGHACSRGYIILLLWKFWTIIIISVKLYKSSNVEWMWLCMKYTLLTQNIQLHTWSLSTTIKHKCTEEVRREDLKSGSLYVCVSIMN